MHVLHVGARPDALPCREDEYVEVTGAILGLLEEEGGGCICDWPMFFPLPYYANYQ